jgi:hypothetical protein
LGASNFEKCVGPEHKVLRIYEYAVFVKALAPPPPDNGPWSCDDYTDNGIGTASLIGETLSSTSCAETDAVVNQYMESVYCTPSCTVVLSSETFDCPGDYYAGDAQHVAATCTSEEDPNRYVTFSVLYW